MTFSHISDMHLGQTQYGSPEREADTYEAFDQAVKTSIKDHVEFVILAGDLFDKPNPGGRAIVSLGNSLKELRDAGIRTYFVLGEHDISRIVSTPVAYVYHNLGVATYVGGGRPVRHGDALIVGFDKMRRDEIPNHAEKLARADSEARNHAGTRILVMHQGITEMNKFAGEIASTDLPRSFSYYAMGHLHDRQTRSFDHLGGLLAYPGSTEVSTNEAVRESEKGFYEVDTSGGEASVSWMRLDTRPHASFSFTYEELKAGVDSVAAELAKHEKKPVAKITVSGRNIDMAELSALVAPLHEASLYCSVTADQGLDRAEIMSGRPTRIDEELMRHTKRSLNDEALSEFAINELLPLLSSGRTDEALRLVLDDYERFKKPGGGP